MTPHRFPIGTRYLSSGKHPRECTVIDQLTTTNAAGEVVSRCYVTSHTFLGQTISETNVCDTTIARGIAGYVWSQAAGSMPGGRADRVECMAVMRDACKAANVPDDLRGYCVTFGLSKMGFGS